ncbi:glycosyltransferase [Cochleicola gelatinilyticus]|uniref:Uncharacterized protein n=1 Tax=Cochleicola gelatinilyticus TaxID=1763537 RepID=A0A167G8L9_9FLAO|nr:glycosyltransferase [Cochleicola gelatinilyticus]OAB77332.1 hypothetical protein ULVI_12580 [Cochleicola gelatinilyticus]
MREYNLLYIYRKRNPGNYSIERIYNKISQQLETAERFPFNLKRYTLRKQFDFGSFLYHFLTSLFSKKKVVHITGASNYMVMAFPFQTRVFTLHDLIRYKKIKGIRGYLYDLFFVKLPIKYSHYIIVVSKKTREELLKNFPNSERKIDLIYNPLIIPKQIIKRTPREITKNNPFKILQIGQKNNKNFERLILATKSLDVEYTFIHSNPDKITALCHKYEIINRSVILTNINDEELYKQYAFHDVLYFASTAEGFGMPIIEAQAHGLPVITSNCSPMDEIGKGAILVDPLNVESITEGFIKLYNPVLVRKVVATGLENSRNFNVDKIVSIYISFYSKLIR